MKKITWLILLLTPTLCLAESVAGLLSVPSSHSVAATADRLASILDEKGMTVFVRIKHSDGARKAGVELNPTELVIFGNPKVGAPLMKCRQSIAIDLPQKALVWQDDSGKVWISYNDPRYLEQRHSVSGCDQVFAKVEKALAGITTAAGAQ